MSTKWSSEEKVESYKMVVDCILRNSFIDCVTKKIKEVIGRNS